MVSFKKLMNEIEMKIIFQIDEDSIFAKLIEDNKKIFRQFIEDMEKKDFEIPNIILRKISEVVSLTPFDEKEKKLLIVRYIVYYILMKYYLELEEEKISIVLDKTLEELKKTDKKKLNRIILYQS